MLLFLRFLSLPWNRDFLMPFNSEEKCPSKALLRRKASRDPFLENQWHFYPSESKCYRSFKLGLSQTFLSERGEESLSPIRFVSYPFSSVHGHFLLPPEKERSTFIQKRWEKEGGVALEKRYVPLLTFDNAFLEPNLPPFPKETWYWTTRDLQHFPIRFSWENFLTKLLIWLTHAVSSSYLVVLWFDYRIFGTHDCYSPISTTTMCGLDEKDALVPEHCTLCVCQEKEDQW